MDKIKPEIGMQVVVPRYNCRHQRIKTDTGTIVGINKSHLTVKLDLGYNESFYYKEVRFRR